MKLSESTLSILKNFSSISPSIIINEGDVLKTIDVNKTVFAIAKLDEEFPGNACIYDVGRFLSVLSLYKEPEIEFHDEHFIIKDGRKKTKYTYAPRSMVTALPTKDIALPSEEVVIELAWEDIENVVKACSRLGLTDIAFSGTGGKCYLEAIKVNRDNSDASSDTFSIDLGVTTTDEFMFILRPERLKLIPQNYTVRISKAGISKFESEKVQYFIPGEKSSAFKKGN